MAYAFGTHASVAAFLMAFRFAHLLRRIFGDSAMNSAFVPLFEELRNTEEDSSHAARFFRDLTATLATVLGFIIAAGAITLTTSIIVLKPSPATREVLVLTCIMLPSLLFICLSAINSALLQCDGRYFTTSAAPIAFNFVWIAATLALAKTPVTDAMPWLAAAIVIAGAMQWSSTLPHTLKTLKLAGGKIQLFSPTVRRLAAPLSLGILGVGAGQINSALDTLFARYADAEGPALLWYAIRIQQVPLALFGISLAGALLPSLSRAEKNGKREEAKRLLRYGLKRTTLWMIPCTVVLCIAGPIGIKLLFAHGSFGVSSADATSQCLWGYAVGLIPMALVLIQAPAFYARSDYSTPTRAAIASVVVNIALNSVMVLWMDWGAASVALATGISAWVNAGLLLWASSQQPAER